MIHTIIILTAIFIMTWVIRSDLADIPAIVESTQNNIRELQDASAADLNDSKTEEKP